jgi:hypothetical protein
MSQNEVLREVEKQIEQKIYGGLRDLLEEHGLIADLFHWKENDLISFTPLGLCIHKHFDNGWTLILDHPDFDQIKDLPVKTRRFPDEREEISRTALTLAIEENLPDLINLLAERQVRLERKMHAFGQEITPAKFAQKLLGKSPATRCLGDWIRRHEACRKAALTLLVARKKAKKKSSIPRLVLVLIGKVNEVFFVLLLISLISFSSWCGALVVSSSGRLSCKKY